MEISGLIGQFFETLGAVWGKIAEFIDSFTQWQLLLPSVIVMGISIVVFRLIGGLLFRLLLLALFGAALYNLIISFDEVRVSAGGQSAAFMVAVAVVFTLVLQMWTGSNRNQRIVEVIFEIILVFVFYFFLTSLAPNLFLGDQAQAVIERTVDFWTSVFQAAENGANNA